MLILKGKTNCSTETSSDLLYSSVKYSKKSEKVKTYTHCIYVLNFGKGSPKKLRSPNTFLMTFVLERFSAATLL